MLALHGLPGLRYLKTTDPDERLLLTALSHRVVVIDQQRQENLARMIVAELAKAMRRHG